MSQTGWDEVGGTESRAKKPFKKDENQESLWLKLDAGKHRIRLFGKPKKIYTLWFGDQKYIVPEDMIPRLESIGLEPRLNYAINCFDRADTDAGKTIFRILEKGNGIFMHFKSYWDNVEDDNGNKVDPGGVNGPEWSIEVVETPNPSSKNKRKVKTEYRVIPIARRPFTPEQVKLILKAKPENKTPEDEKLPLGMRGPIDLEKFYDMKKAAEKLNIKLSEISGVKTDTSVESATNGINDILSATEAVEKQNSTPQIVAQTNSNSVASISGVSDEQALAADVDRVLNDIVF